VYAAVRRGLFERGQGVQLPPTRAPAGARDVLQLHCVLHHRRHQATAAHEPRRPSVHRRARQVGQGECEIIYFFAPETADCETPPQALNPET